VSRAWSGQGTWVNGLSEPLTPQTRALLRRVVRDHAGHERRRAYPPVLHVGTPGGRVADLALAATGACDPGLRTDVVAAMRARAGTTAPHLVWLTRSGGLELQDVDTLWLAAARAAYAEAEVPLDFVVVNRHGWRDPRTGAGQTWVRVRPDPPPR